MSKRYQIFIGVFMLIFLLLCGYSVYLKLQVQRLEKDLEYVKDRYKKNIIKNRSRIIELEEAKEDLRDRVEGLENRETDYNYYYND